MRRATRAPVPEPRQQRRHESREQQPGQLGAHPLADRRLADADGDERRRPCAVVGDGHDDPRTTARGCRCSPPRRSRPRAPPRVAEEPLPDLASGRDGCSGSPSRLMTTTKSVPDSTRTRSAYGWSTADGSGPRTTGDDVGRGGHRLGDREGPGDGLLVAGPLRLAVRPGEPGGDDEHGDEHLQREGLRRDAPATRAHRAPGSRLDESEAQRRTSGRENSMNTKVTLVTGRGQPRPFTGPGQRARTPTNGGHRELHRRQRRRRPAGLDPQARPHPLPLHRRHRRHGGGHPRRMRLPRVRARASSPSAPASSTSSR